ncbi:MAG TPA: hypothetical protein VKV77_10245 [Methylovirgula sp.]|nr:hypothetical protein [Methylovirgula sp.]
MSVFQRQDTPFFGAISGHDLLRLALLSLAALIAISLGIDFLFEANNAPSAVNEASVPAQSPAPAEPLRIARQKIEREILSQSPDYARFFGRLRQILPNEYEAVFDDFAKQSLDGVDVSNVDSLVSEAVRDVRLSNGVLAAKADGPALSHIFDMQLKMMQALAVKDPRLCVDFLYGGASQAFFAFSAQNRQLVADMAIAGLDAINSGRISNIERERPTDSDFDTLENALKAQGLSEAEVGAILDGKTPDPPIADERMCTVGQTYLKTLASLPEPVRLRIYGLAVELMARS